MRYLGARLSFLLLSAGSVLAVDHAVIQELSDADLARIDVKDGSVSDWLTVIGEPTLTAWDFMANEGYSRYDPSDLDFRVWLGWHGGTERLYCAVERVDDVYVNEFPGHTFTYPCGVDSCVELLVDGDHSGGLFVGRSGDYERDRMESNQQAQAYQALGESPPGRRHVDLSEMGGFLYNEPRWYLDPPYADGGGGAWGESPRFYVTEFYVTPFDRFVWNDPAASQVSDLRAGAVIGIGLFLKDYDVPKASAPHYNYPRDSRHAFGYGGLDYWMGDSSQWAEALLLGKDEAPVSWDQVHLSLETWASSKLRMR